MTGAEIYDNSDKSWMKPLVYDNRVHRAALYAERQEALGDQVDLCGASIDEIDSAYIMLNGGEAV
jgi:hypothetical protein